MTEENGAGVNPEPSHASISDSLSGLTGDMAEAKEARGDLAHAILALADSQRMLSGRLPTRQERRLAKITIAIQTFIIAVLAVLVVLLYIGQSDGHKTLGIIKNATSPAAQAAGAAQLDNKIRCIEIHADNDIYALIGLPLKTVPKYCPSGG